ncbi:MAG: metallophosphoesterase [Candidatus Delongbacteria bacterium]|nr:metallophosphoesterase [Candidatus Delongbacteria bacterium]MBN2833355.1 metallophosphoesterase [Candidatus Delongbacteria bacterium]
MKVLFLLIAMITLFGNDIKDAIKNNDHKSLNELMLVNDQRFTERSDSLDYLMYAVYYGDSSSVDLILKAGADQNIQLSGKTPLMQAVKYKKDKALEALLKFNPNLLLEDKDKLTSLDYSVKYRNPKAVKLLYTIADRTEEIPSILDKISYKLNGTDGPYLFYENDTIKKITVNSENQINSELFDSEYIEIKRPDCDKFFKVNIQNKILIPETEYENIPRFIATSDIEGNFDAFTRILISSGVTDEDLNWIYGDGHFVFIGDMVDRGEYVTECLWLLYKLDYEARSAGGQVHYIIGNHELLNIEDDNRYVVDKYIALAEQLKITNSYLFSENTVIGRWIRSKNIVEKINDTILVHAGLSNEIKLLDLSMLKLNNLFRDYLSGKKSEITEQIVGSFGPLWYRGLVYDQSKYQKIDDTKLSEVLSYFNANYIMIGHTVVEKISTDFNNKVIRIDLHHPETVEEKVHYLKFNDNKFYNCSELNEEELLF